LTLKENSIIAAQAIGTNASGGDITINAQNIFAFPNQNQGDGNDIVANSPEGIGGNIEINAPVVFGIKEGTAIVGNNINDIDASGTVEGLSPVVITTGIQDKPQIISSEQTTEQVCESDRETAAKNGLVINGKGGIPAPPDQPLAAQDLIINGEIVSASAIPEPIETSDGKKVQLARGIKFTKDGGVILTPYPTNNAGERIPEGRINCGEG
jgi:large exoprotein involved in heme utilization and adhesion